MELTSVGRQLLAGDRAASEAELRSRPIPDSGSVCAGLPKPESPVWIFMEPLSTSSWPLNEAQKCLDMKLPSSRRPPVLRWPRPTEKQAGTGGYVRMGVAGGRATSSAFPTTQNEGVQRAQPAWFPPGHLSVSHAVFCSPFFLIGDGISSCSSVAADPFTLS